MSLIIDHRSSRQIRICRTCERSKAERYKTHFSAFDISAKIRISVLLYKDNQEPKNSAHLQRVAVNVTLVVLND